MSDIHDLMHENTPDEPSTAGWADRVRGRRQRRRAVTGVAAGVLAVGLAVPVGVSLLNRPMQVARPADGTTAPAALPARDAGEVCAEARQQMTVAIAATTYANPGDPVLQEGAVRAWLCGDDSAEEGMVSGTRGPLDPLTVDVDKAVSWFLDAQPSDPDQACTMEYRLTYVVAFEYEDGSLIPVQGELHGCRTVTDGSRYVDGGDGFLDLLTDLWLANRVDAELVSVDLCTTGSVFAAKPEDAVSAAVCIPAADGTRGAAHLPDPAAIGASIAANSVDVDSVTTALDPQSTTLELMNSSGDILSLERLAEGGYLFFEGDQARAWTPSTDESAVLDAAIAGAGE